MTIVEFHKDRCLIKSCQKIGTLLLNKPCLEMNEIVHLIQYSNKKTNFRKIKSILYLEN